MGWLSMFIVISVIYLLVMAPSSRYDPPCAEKADPWLMAAAFTLMLLIRLVLAATVIGYRGDVQIFQSWAMRIANDLPGFYSGGVFADYPPRLHVCPVPRRKAQGIVLHREQCH